MPTAARGITLTNASILGLFFIQRYRFLTIGQFARASGLQRSSASDQLRSLERHGVLGHFGNVGIRGYGKTPKVYFLKRKGYELLVRESDIPPELIGNFKEANVGTRWSPQMYHRLHTVDLLVATEVGVRARENLNLTKTFIEYRRVKRGTRIARETTDFVADEEIAENRIIPDGGFVLENLDTGRRGLFFVEMDMATERIVTSITRDVRVTLHHKISQYDRYLTSGRFARTYAAWGEFKFFTLLFVTFGDKRVDNVRREMSDLPPELAPYFRFSTFERANADFLGAVWKTRSLTDNDDHALVREQPQPAMAN
jgi:hypothetical protein